MGDEFNFIYSLCVFLCSVLYCLRVRERVGKCPNGPPTIYFVSIGLQTIHYLKNLKDPQLNFNHVFGSHNNDILDLNK